MFVYCYSPNISIYNIYKLSHDSSVPSANTSFKSCIRGETLPEGSLLLLRSTRGCDLWGPSMAEDSIYFIIEWHRASALPTDVITISNLYEKTCHLCVCTSYCLINLSVSLCQVLYLHSTLLPGFVSPLFSQFIRNFLVYIFCFSVISSIHWLLPKEQSGPVFLLWSICQPFVSSLQGSLLVSSFVKHM